MTEISNAEKQARFRKKELLKREADKIFRQWESSIGRWRYSKRTPEEVRHALDEAVALPSGWTETDYEFALKKLGQYHLDLISSVDQIANDIDGDWASRKFNLMTAVDPDRSIADYKAAVEKAWAVASHLISALKLSNCVPSEQAAIVMEVVRYVARSLVSNREIHQSQATAMCLANAGPQYDRPAWFAEKLAETIRQQVGSDLAHEVGLCLSQTAVN
jgi:hypothetical protein